MNPDLDLLQPYPFQRLASLFSGVQPNPALRPISLGIGEPEHPTPERIRAAITANLDGLAAYPATAGSEALPPSCPLDTTDAADHAPHGCRDGTLSHHKYN